MQQQQREQEEQAQRIVYKYYDKYKSTLNIYFSTSANVLKKVFQKIDCLTLNSITLYDMQIKDQLADVLFEFEFNTLEQINLDGSNIGKEGVRKLFEKQWPTVKQISLSKNNIGNEGLQILMCRAPDRAQKLYVNSNGISLLELKFPLTFQAPNLSNLKQLNLDQNKLGQRGVQYLVKGDLSQLEELSLLNCSLSIGSIKDISKGHWPMLAEFAISYNSGLIPRCLGNLEGVNWRLVSLQTTFKNNFSIHYFSTLVRYEAQQRQLSIRLASRGGGWQFKEVVLTANVRIR